MQNPVVLILHQDFPSAKALESSSPPGLQALFAEDFTEAFHTLRGRKVSCMVIDPHFKGAERSKEIVQLRRQFMTIPMILYGRFADPDLPRKYGEAGIQRCIRMGALEDILEAVAAAIAEYGFQPDGKVFGIDPEKCSPRLEQAIRLMYGRFSRQPIGGGNRLPP